MPISLRERKSIMKKITDDDFKEKVFEVGSKLIELFDVKNEQYAKESDVLEAIKESADRRYGVVTKDTLSYVILDYKDKHDLALLKKGIKLGDTKERLLDIIAYCILLYLVYENDV